MSKSLLKRGFALGILVLFIGLIITPSLSGDTIENSKKLSNSDNEKSSSEIDWWPQFQHDSYNTGYSTSDAPQTSTIKWIFDTGELLGGHPVIADGKVYIGSDSEYFFCLDVETGEEIWSYPIPGGTSVSCPIVYDNKVCTGTTYYSVFCWNAFTGDLIWEYTKPYGGCKSPAFDNGRIFITKSRGNTENNGSLYCLDANTGQEIWVIDMGWYELSSPTVYDNMVYICSEDGFMYCFNANNGSYIWMYNTGRRVDGCAPTLHDNIVFCGGRKTNCIDAYNGSIIWQFEIGMAFSSPAIAYDNIFFLGYNGYVYCLNVSTGEEQWSYSAYSSTWEFSNPAVADKKIYFGIQETGDLICLNVDTGEKIWDCHIAVPDWFQNSPAIANGMLFIGNGLPGKLYCFQDPTNNSSPLTPTIYGPTEGKPDIEYEYTFNATDPEEDPIMYFVYWGDNNTEWTEYGDSGEEIKLKHAWYEEGEYNIKAKAKDIFDAESEWSDPHIIIIEAKPPHVEITKPQRAIYIKDRVIIPFIVPVIFGDIQIWFWAEDSESGLNRTELYIDDELKEVFTIIPKSWLWDEKVFFKHTITVKAYDNAGNNATTEIKVWKFF